MMKGMEKKFKVLRRMHDSIYSNISEIFQAYLFSLDFSKQEEVENGIRTNRLGIMNIRENLGANSLLNSFDLFYYIIGRFPFTTGHLYVPDREISDEVNGEKLNIKEIV